MVSPAEFTECVLNGAYKAKRWDHRSLFPFGPHAPSSAGCMNATRSTKPSPSLSYCVQSIWLSSLPNASVSALCMRVIALEENRPLQSVEPVYGFPVQPPGAPVYVTSLESSAAYP